MGLKQWLWGRAGRQWVWPLGLLVALSTLLLSELAYRGAAAQLDELVTLGRARLELVRLVARVADAESGQRGYLISGRPDYLEPYRFAAEDATAGLAALHQFYGQVQHQQAEQRTREIARAVATKLSELQEVLKLAQAGRPEAARELMLTDIGRDQMDSIRRQAAELLADENRQIAASTGRVFDTLMLHRLGVAAMTVLSLLLFTLFLRQSRALERQRRERQAQVLAERDHLEQEVQRRTAELTQLARHLQTAREDERARLARDLHDELGALLTAAKLDVARLKPRLAEAPELQARLAHLTEALNSGIALKRRIIEDLRPSTLDQLGLAAALDILCRETADRLAIPIDLQVDAAARLSRSAQLTAFRLVQEGLNNMAKYAQASRASVSLRVEEGQVLLQLQDDGRGFQLDQVALASHGLLGMRFRVEAEQGRLRVHSAPGQGCTLSAWLPLEPGPTPAV
jgi:signal transduction histidine kinase